MANQGAACSLLTEWQHSSHRSTIYLNLAFTSIISHMDRAKIGFSMAPWNEWDVVHGVAWREQKVVVAICPVSQKAFRIRYIVEVHSRRIRN